jgi:hypothetical protein
MNQKSEIFLLLIRFIKMNKQNISDHIIETLRKTVLERYQFNNLQNIGKPSFFITKEVVEELRIFFLQYIYPDADARIILNRAFENLEKHFKNPRHILDLMGSGISMAFKFGIQFPKALKAGLNTLDSFKQAMKFEDILCEAALAQNIQLPVTTDDFEKLVSLLPPSQVQDFIKNSEKLFITLTDIPLLEKSIQIITELIHKMEAKSDIYDYNDIQGIKTGLKILEGGHHLFYNMSNNEKRMIIEIIMDVEYTNLKRIYDKYQTHP